MIDDRLWHLDNIRIAGGLIEPVVDEGIQDRPASIERTIDVLVDEPGITDQPGQGLRLSQDLVRMEVIL